MTFTANTSTRPARLVPAGVIIPGDKISVLTAPVHNVEREGRDVIISYMIQLPNGEWVSQVIFRLDRDDQILLRG